MNTKTILAIVVAALAAIILAIWGWNAWQASSAAGAQGRVEKNQTVAAQDNAKDAVATVAATAGNEAASAYLTRTNELEIRNAKGADMAVDPAVRDVGLIGLCRRRAFEHDPKCLRFTPATNLGVRR